MTNAVVLTGPTGSGKSALALQLAEQLGGELIAMDSMTLYRGMDIGTAKPTPSEQARVPHHLIDRLEVWEAGNVAWWLAQANAACQEIGARGRRPIFVGGTPLYLKALLHGLTEAPPADPATRQHWEHFAATHGAAALHQELHAVDPVTARRLHINDVRRVVRALEIFTLTRKPMSEQPANWDRPPNPVPVVVLNWPREELYRRIEQRVDAMLAAGWLNEVRRLRDVRPPPSKEARQALGYRELLDYLEGHRNWPETVELIKTHTRQFAKRQLTWFRGLPGLHWLDARTPQLQEQVKKLWQISEN